jgi:chaperonin GroEL (HSP60 family)
LRVADKDFNHPRMPTIVRNTMMAILTCPLVPPKPKTKHKLDIRTAENHRKLYEKEQQYFWTQIKALNDCKVNPVICQRSFDDEAIASPTRTSCWPSEEVGDVELQLIVKDLTFGTTKEQMRIIASEIATSLAIVAAADTEQMTDQYSRRAFATAFEAIPIVLAENLANDEMPAAKTMQQSTQTRSMAWTACRQASPMTSSGWRAS